MKNKEKKEKIIPVNKDITDLIKDNFKGNFSLWFYKFTELTKENNYYKADSNAASDYLTRYNQIKSVDNVKKILKDFHVNQIKFCEYFQKNYEKLVIVAKLESKLITGVGISHPNEVGLALDYISGIPYIPATSIKGIVRTVFQEEESLKKIFGSEDNKGNIIFLDSYPKDIPELCEDIINPHYGKYYSEREPPADYLQPVPVKFLVVKEGTEFIFRFLLKKDINKNNFKSVIEKSVEEYGLGAKTAIGYGLFKTISMEEPADFIKYIKDQEELERKLVIEKKLSKMSKIEKICYKLENDNNEEYANIIFNNYLNKGNISNEDKIKIAKSLKKFLEKFGKWDNGLSKNEKIRVQKVKNILGID